MLSHFVFTIECKIMHQLALSKQMDEMVMILHIFSSSLSIYYFVEHPKKEEIKEKKIVEWNCRWKVKRPLDIWSVTKW